MLEHPARTGLSIVLVTVSVFLLPSPSAVLAQAPRTISYQGALTDSLGVPVADATRLMTFSIYDAPQNGIELWTESKNVSTTGGVFNTLLGSSTEITGFRFDRPLWLGTSIAGDPEISPRVKLSSVPSAHALVLPFVAEEDTTAAIVDVYNAGTGDVLKGSNLSTGAGVRGASTSGPGVYGSTSNGYGVSGRAFGSAGVGGLFWGYESGGIVQPDIVLQGRGLIQSSGTLALDAINDSVAVEADLSVVGRTLLEDTVTIRTLDIAYPANAGMNEDLKVLSSDAMIGLYSNAGGAFGSGVQFGEINGGLFRDKWSILRKTYPSGSSLLFTYGAGANYAANPALVEFDTAGAVIADAFKYRDPKTLYYSINASAFVSDYTEQVTRSSSAVYVSGVSGGLGYMYAAVNLPHGAILKELTCLLRDDSALDLRCGLARRTYGDSAGAADFGHVQTSGTPGFTSLSVLTTPIDVDNSNSTLVVSVVPVSGSWYTVGSQLQIEAVTIRYELGEAQ